MNNSRILNSEQNEAILRYVSFYTINNVLFDLLHGEQQSFVGMIDYLHFDCGLQVSEIARMLGDYMGIDQLIVHCEIERHITYIENLSDGIIN